MKQIIDKLTELTGICEIRIKKVDSERSELASLRLNLNEQKEEQAERTEYLKDENEKLNRKKLIADTIHHANQILKEASEKVQSIKNDREALDRECKVHNERMSREKREFDRKKDKADKERKSLSVEKERYKTEVLNEIAKEQKLKAMKEKK